MTTAARRQTGDVGPARPRVIVADDHPDMAADLVRLLTPAFDVVATVGDGRDLIEAARILTPDVIVSDIGMPGLSGLAAARIILSTSPSMPVVLATIRSDAALVRHARASGILGFVVKDDVGEELVAAVEAALDGRPYISSAVRHSTGEDSGTPGGKA